MIEEYSREIAIMKPLASQGSETGSRGNIGGGNGDSTEDKKNFHLVGILNPDSNTSRCKGWIFIVASKELPEEMDEIKKGTSYLGQLRFSPDQRRELLSHFSPKKMTADHECLYAGKYFINDWRGQPLKLTGGSAHSSSNNKKSVVAIEDHVEFLQSQKWKFLVDELDEYCMFLLPVDPNTGVVIDGVNLEGNVMSRPVTRRGIAGGRLIGQEERKGWKGEQLPLPMGLFITREQWKALMGCLQTLHENLLGGGGGAKQRSAGLLSRGKNRKQLELLKAEENDACGNVNKSGFLKWIIKRNRKGGKRGIARAKNNNNKNNNNGGCTDEEEYEEEACGETPQDEGNKEKKAIKIARKSNELKKFLLQKKKKKTESDQKQGKGAEKSCDKVKRINFSMGKGQGSKNMIKKKKQNEDASSAAAATFEVAADEMVKDKQLIKIELKPDPMMKDPSFQFRSGDLLRLKLTMYNDGPDVDFINEKKEEDSSYQVEIDFVQNFMCETDTLDACRCRRITKLLKRTITNDLKWEKGIHISGKQFALCWIPYWIPGLEPEEVGNRRVKEGNVEEDEKEVEGVTNNVDDLSMGCLDSKFKVTDFQFELQIRFYQKDDEQSHYILSACSCFPLNVTMMMMMEIGATKSTDELSWCATSSGGGDTILQQVFQDVVEEEEERENQEVDAAGKRATVIACQMIMVKSLSATEFDV